MSRLGLSLCLIAVAACGGSQATADAAPRAATREEARPERVASVTPAEPRAAEEGPKATPTAEPAAKRAPADGAAAKDPASLPKKIGARHVLVQYMGAERAAPAVVRTKDQALVVAKEVLRLAKSGGDVARLAVEYSDEPGAGARGGSLGRFGRGQMVPAFEEVAFRLGVGEISDIVETPFGFHVIQRTE